MRFPANCCDPPDPSRVSRFLGHFLADPRFFTDKTAVVTNPNRGVFFAGCRTGSHGAAPNTPMSQYVPLRRHPCGLTRDPASATFRAS